MRCPWSSVSRLCRKAFNISENWARFRMDWGYARSRNVALCAVEGKTPTSAMPAGGCGRESPLSVEPLVRKVTCAVSAPQLRWSDTE